MAFSWKLRRFSLQGTLWAVEQLNNTQTYQHRAVKLASVSCLWFVQPSAMLGIQLGEHSDEEQIVAAYSHGILLNHHHVFIWQKHCQPLSVDCLKMGAILCPSIRGALFLCSEGRRPEIRERRMTMQLHALFYFPSGALSKKKRKKKSFQPPNRITTIREFTVCSWERPGNKEEREEISAVLKLWQFTVCCQRGGELGRESR